MTVICTVCARGGSKGVPGKNHRPLAGKPLILWTIELALACRLFDRVVVSSDDPVILEIGRAAGVDLAVRRPDALATDEAGKLPAILHVATAAEQAFAERYDTVVDLDATSPLRRAEDVAGALALFEAQGVTNVITGALARRSPYFNLVERDPDGAVRLCKPPETDVSRRQDAAPCFDMNASIYVWRHAAFRADPRVFYPDTLLYEMPEERSLDIDSALDFRIVEMLMRDRLAEADTRP